MINETTDIENRASIAYPRIYYCSRTHSQIQQVIDELKGMQGVYTDELNTTLLASRKLLCINKEVKNLSENSDQSIDSLCSDFVKNFKCSYHHKTNAVIGAMYNKISPAGVVVPKNGGTICDIEDLVELGKKHRGTYC